MYFLWGKKWQFEKTKIMDIMHNYWSESDRQVIGFSVV